MMFSARAEFSRTTFGEHTQRKTDSQGKNNNKQFDKYLDNNTILAIVSLYTATVDFNSNN